MRLALCQINVTVGDISGNRDRIARAAQDARAQGAELVLTPELALTGYPPEDLLLREHFIADAHAALLELATQLAAQGKDKETAKDKGASVIVGAPIVQDGRLYNAAIVLADGEVQAIYRKMHLPNYGVFDERRYFAPGPAGQTIELAGATVGVTVCEDLWQPGPPATEEAAAGARLLTNISASPYHTGKGLERERLFGRRARESSSYVAFCGLVGGQDELVFDGHSFVLDPSGETIARGAQFAEDLVICDVELSLTQPPGAASGRYRSPRPIAEAGQPRAEPDGGGSAGATGGSSRTLRALLEPIEAEVYGALELGLRDYVEKNGFANVVLGLSGGIDSALVACVAVDALGAERVNVAIMPSPYSSVATQSDAHALARALGVRAHELPIGAAMDSYERILHAEFAGLPADITEENLQARIRGNLLMALSNKHGWLVLTTGNKSEMSVGYTTLYGDLAGGFAVIKDVPKTLVYRLCEWRNAPGARPAGVPEPIPRSIIARAPSAELREDQRDEDSLPPYELLDEILYGYIELDRSREQLIAQGLPEREVDRTIELVDLAEYKRRQAPPGIKLTTRAFGRDRRMPITNRYRG